MNKLVFSQADVSGNFMTMEICKVISFRNAWSTLLKEHQAELDDIRSALPNYVEEFVAIKKKSARLSQGRDTWERLMTYRGWHLVERTFFTDFGHRVSVSNIGPIKNSVSAFVGFGHFELLNRWLFQQTAIANKYDISKIPILLVPAEDFARQLDERFLDRNSFESYLKQITPLVPLSHSYPFLILGFTNQYNIDGPEVYELEPDSYVNSSEVIVDRCIEFPPEYHQAGLGILNYFSTYINEQYPDEDAKVKIEQHGKIVRLIIETATGKKEIIEKALTEYQLVVTGQKKPEDITQNQKLILELNSELRIAKYRIETQQDLIQLQGGQIDKLLTLIGQGLISKPLNIDFRPQITLNNSVSINQSISNVISDLNDLKQLIPASGSDLLVLEDLGKSLEGIEKENNPEKVKSSPALKKLRGFIDNVSEGQSTLAKAVKVAEDGWETFKTLAGKYNKIAEWCGLPQVPSLFTN